jgi:serine protease AprX
MSEEENRLPGVLFEEIEYPQSKKQGEKVRVTLEVDQEVGQKALAAMSSEDFTLAAMSSEDFGDIGLQIDDVLGEAPISASQEAMASDSTQKKQNNILVSGFIEEKDIDKLKSYPHIVKVFRRDPDKEKLGFYSCPEGWTGSACDCGGSHGTINDVANYLHVNELWNQGFKGDGIVVGVMDGGITAEGRQIKSNDTNHQDWPGKLIKNVIGGYRTDWGTSGIAVISDGRAIWHGNMVATDVLGMAPDAKVYDLKILGGRDVLDNAFKALDWAIKQHRINQTPHILVNSWGPYEGGSEYAEDINHYLTLKYIEAIKEGIIVIFAAGNCGLPCGRGDSRCGRNNLGSGVSILGCNGHPDIITIGGVNVNEEYIGYSSQGPSIFRAEKPDFCAVTHFQGYYDNTTPLIKRDGGTSAAAPIAAGAIALLKQGDPSLTHHQIKSILKQTAKDVGPAGEDIFSGAGIIQPKDAMERIRTMNVRA